MKIKRISVCLVKLGNLDRVFTLVDVRRVIMMMGYLMIVKSVLKDANLVEIILLV